MSSDIYERMARLRAIKAQKKRERDQQPEAESSTSPGNDPLDTAMAEPAPRKRTATPRTRTSNQLPLSDMMSSLFNQSKPVHNTDGSEASGYSVNELYSSPWPAPVKVTYKQPVVQPSHTPMTLDDDVDEPNQPTHKPATAVAKPPPEPASADDGFFGKLKKFVGSAADSYNANTPSVAVSVGTAAAKLGIGLVGAWALAKATAPSKTTTTTNPYSQSSFYM